MAEKKFFVDINLQGSALTNAKIGTNSGIGSTEGAFGYDSSAHRLQYFDGTATKEVANLSDISAVTGGLIFQGGYDPTTNTPDIADGTALKGFFWAATAAGTFLGESVQVGDSIVAKVDNAGATIADWLILQGNIVVATDSVDGISRLATQTEANAGTEAGAVVITPATLQGKIDAQITPEISNKLPLAGGTMSGSIDMGNNDLNNVQYVSATGVAADQLISTTTPNIALGSNLDADNAQTIINLPTPIDGGDAANKTYVDGAASTAQANAEATASADATAKADAAEAAANAYTDTGLATKLDLAGGTMSGEIDMAGNKLRNVDTVYTENLDAKPGFSEIKVLTTLNADSHAITNLPAPAEGGDATNKTYVDSELNATRYTGQAGVLDWTLAGGVYTQTITHNLSSAYPVVQLFDQNNKACELGVDVIDAGSILLTSNIQLGGNIYVTVLKGGAF